MQKHNKLSCQVKNKKFVVDFWDSCFLPNNVLLIHSHGMESYKYLSSHCMPKSFAFIIPPGNALNNSGLINQSKSNRELLREIPRVFSENMHQFTEYTIPNLTIYPYLYPINNLDIPLDFFSDECGIDVIKVVDLLDNNNNSVETSLLSELLLATHPKYKWTTIGEYYEGFLLFTCRTSTRNHKIGMGGGAPYYPDGLYRANPVEIKPIIKFGW